MIIDEANQELETSFKKRGSVITNDEHDNCPQTTHSPTSSRSMSQVSDITMGDIMHTECSIIMNKRQMSSKKNS